MSGQPVRLMIVDDHPAARQGLRLRLGREPDLAVVGEAVDVQGAVQRVAHLRPDVVLVDLALPDGDGIDLVARLREGAPASRCIVLTMDDSAPNRQRARAAGVAAFIGKHESTEVLLTAIRSLGASAPR